MGENLKLLGKPGHKGRNIKSKFLIIASEFVRLKLGDYFDEHLAELYEAVTAPPFKEELSGDAIRKKRKYLKTNYPGLYAEILKEAMRASDLAGSGHPF